VRDFPIDGIDRGGREREKTSTTPLASNLLEQVVCLHNPDELPPHRLELNTSKTGIIIPYDVGVASSSKVGRFFSSLSVSMEG